MCIRDRNQLIRIQPRILHPQRRQYPLLQHVHIFLPADFFNHRAQHLKVRIAIGELRARLKIQRLVLEESQLLRSRVRIHPPLAKLLHIGEVRNPRSVPQQLGQRDLCLLYTSRCV